MWFKLGLSRGCPHQTSLVYYSCEGRGGSGQRASRYKSRGQVLHSRPRYYIEGPHGRNVKVKTFNLKIFLCFKSSANKCLQVEILTYYMVQNSRGNPCTAAQSQKSVSAHFTSQQILFLALQRSVVGLFV